MHEEMSPAMRRRLKTLGDDIRTARRKRRISQADLASRIGVSTGTVKRLEAGDPGVAIGTLAMALLAYGKIDRLVNLLPEEADDIGLWIDRENLPQRIRKRKRDREVALF
ncbi:MAG: helix-turn-helix transcriptional regulator [Gammaproteobacteria bacterium]|nr:helix-turn-helix transcriptional regulator [Gammaproteobacteria bacterium]MDE0443957.1 helix-turn-helix transcriptional regulator [Gammaproteobacteria bacterium]